MLKIIASAQEKSELTTNKALANQLIKNVSLQSISELNYEMGGFRQEKKTNTVRTLLSIEDLLQHFTPNSDTESPKTDLSKDASQKLDQTVALFKKNGHKITIGNYSISSKNRTPNAPLLLTAGLLNLLETKKNSNQRDYIYYYLSWSLDLLYKDTSLSEQIKADVMRETAKEVCKKEDLSDYNLSLCENIAAYWSEPTIGKRQ